MEPSKKLLEGPKAMALALRDEELQLPSPEKPAAETSVGFHPYSDPHPGPGTLSAVFADHVVRTLS